MYCCYHNPLKPDWLILIGHQNTSSTKILLPTDSVLMCLISLIKIKLTLNPCFYFLKSPSMKWGPEQVLTRKVRITGPHKEVMHTHIHTWTVESKAVDLIFIFGILIAWIPFLISAYACEECASRNTALRITPTYTHTHTHSNPSTLNKVIYISFLYLFHRELNKLKCMELV